MTKPIPSLARIRGALRQADIEGLIKTGAPDDEYDPEAEMIREECQRSPAKCSDRAAQAATIRRVWQEMFELDEHELDKRESAFASAARKIFRH